MSESKSRKLSELINDERARRAYAEKELAEERRLVREWRRRARKAEAAARFSLRLPQRRSSAPAATPERRRIVFPAIRAAVSGAPDWLSQAFDVVDLDGVDEAVLSGLDLVMVGGEQVPDALRSWLDWSTRQPLVSFDSSGELADLLSRAHVDLHVGQPGSPTFDPLAPGPIDPGEPDEMLDAERVARRIVGSRQRTVRDAAIALLTGAGLEPPRGAFSITAVAMTKRPHRVMDVIETLHRTDVSGLHIFLATHGFSPSAQERRVGEERFGERIRFFEMPERSPLGRCLNELVDQTTTEAWAKIDDDDFYGPLYFEEALLELERTGADMVGKLTHYLYDSILDKTFLLQTGNEYRYTRYVPGPTFVGRRHTWEEVRFPHRHARVDSIFIRGMNALGMSIYSTSRFEFSYGRGEASHTWHVDESFYEAKGRLVGEGFAADEIFLPEAH